MTEKTCTKCHETKSVDLFNKKSGRVNQWASYCKACLGKYNRAKYGTKYQRSGITKRIDWLDDYAIAHGCKSCGECHPACLEFHHREPEEKESGVRLMARTNAKWERIWAEVAKCDVLCANCHAKHHARLRKAAAA